MSKITTLNPTPKPTNPVLIDRVLASLQDILYAKLSWLDFAFGKIQRLVAQRDSKDWFYPGAYAGTSEYVNLLPSNQFGNYSFFVINDPQTVDYKPHEKNLITAPYALIVWFNIEKVYPGTLERKTEDVKAELLKVITESIIPKGRITIEKIYEQPENIFKTYSLKELETQYLMHPYAGIRIEGQILIRETC